MAGQNTLSINLNVDLDAYQQDSTKEVEAQKNELIKQIESCLEIQKYKASKILNGVFEELTNESKKTDGRLAGRKADLRNLTNPDEKEIKKQGANSYVLKVREAKDAATIGKLLKQVAKDYKLALGGKLDISL